MKSWDERPKELANLLNPAFCCSVLTSSIVGYNSNVQNSGMPFSLSFMALPIVLHKSTRELIPRSSKTSMISWLQDNPSIKIKYYERVLSLKPFTKEALVFGYVYQWISLNKKGKLQSNFGENKINYFLRKVDIEVKDCMQRSRILGKMFAKAGSLNNIMDMWGIDP
jgi:hypothetical protein